MVYFKSDNIISALGFSTQETFSNLLAGEIGIKQVDDSNLYPEPFPASLVDESRLDSEYEIVSRKYSNNKHHTKLEKMIILSVEDALSVTDVDIVSDRTAIVLSSTKGNIDLLSKYHNNNFDKDRVSLWKLAQVVAEFFNNPVTPIVVSNACISGVIAVNVAAGFVNSGVYDNVVVTGGDIVSRFVVSGFMSFMSLSPNPCKPFDEKRDGLSLGEGAGTIILSKDPLESNNIAWVGGGSANDANHISGPSRTGEGSYLAIQKSMNQAQVKATEINHISAHGTATAYNDEMESLAIDRSGLTQSPVNSFKGNWGHTLGAAGIIETVAMLQEMKTNTLIKSAGFNKSGVTKPINVITKNESKEISIGLKMASGFGGSNAALIAKKVK